jgi:hypothetical protein
MIIERFQWHRDACCRQLSVLRPLSSRRQWRSLAVEVQAVPDIFSIKLSSIGFNAQLDRAIQYSRSVITGSPVKPGDGNEVSVSNEIS